MVHDMFVVVIASLAGGLFSLVGGAMLLIGRRNTRTVASYITPFAAGSLLAAAFTDLLIEAAHEGEAAVALRMTMMGIVVFFLMERLVRWFHHHHAEETVKVDATLPLIVFGDTVHNFIDGIAIAAAFIVDPTTGVVTTFAVAAHEIPQEIGDFGLMLDKGMSKSGVLKVNVVSSLATTIAAIIFYAVGQSVHIPLGAILGLVAGFFVYIAVSDIIPSIHENEREKLFGMQTAMLLLGIVIVGIVSSSLHGLIK